MSRLLQNELRAAIAGREQKRAAVVAARNALDACDVIAAEDAVEDLDLALNDAAAEGGAVAQAAQRALADAKGALEMTRAQHAGLEARIQVAESALEAASRRAARIGLRLTESMAHEAERRYVIAARAAAKAAARWQSVCQLHRDLTKAASGHAGGIPSVEPIYAHLNGRLDETMRAEGVSVEWLPVHTLPVMSEGDLLAITFADDESAMAAE